MTDHLFRCFSSAVNESSTEAMAFNKRGAYEFITMKMISLNILREIEEIAFSLNILREIEETTFEQKP